MKNEKSNEYEKNRLATIVIDSNDAITIQDLEGNITAWNKGATEMYGYSESEALKMNIKDIIPEEKAKEYSNFIENIKKGKIIKSFETMRRTKSGKILDVWLTVTKLKNDSGNPVEIATTERDITEKKIAEEEVQKLSAIVKNTFEAFAMVDLGKTNLLQYVNPAWEKFFGYKSKDVVNKKEGLIISAAKRDPEIYNRFKLAIKQKKKFFAEMEWKRKDGKLIHVNVNSAPLFDDQGNIVTWFNTIRDITDRKKT